MRDFFMNNLHDFKWANNNDQHVITINDDDYPLLLKEIPNPPQVLYIKGDKDLLQFPQLAMVGSRNPTSLGAETAQSFASFLAKMGFVITSGLALGIDSASHQGALKTGKTIAVLGTGIGQLYPKANQSLANDIIKNGGALISEFPVNEPPKKENFPRRNRIISGLAIGTLVVEATLQSGSLITARFAAEQGRELFAIPGSIHNPQARGCHKLIREGAKLVETAEDILEELKSAVRGFPTKRQLIPSIKNCVPNEKKLDVDYEKLLSCVGFEPTNIDLLVERTAFKADEIASMLLILELDGLIQSAPGGYIRAS
jgi:DNA processing protein